MPRHPMKPILHSLPATGLVAALALLLAACPEPAPDTDTPFFQEDPAPEAPAAAGEAYEAQLQEVDGSGVTGTATVVIDGDDIRVTVRVTGLNPNTEVPLHIHTNASCDPAGGILLNLDRTLTTASEAAPRGEHYASTDGDGVLEYEVNRSLNDLRSAAEGHGDPGIDQLDLGNRVVNVHAADMRPVACGPLNPRS
jgi:Cu/Zn superoxide dismutase